MNSKFQTLKVTTNILVVTSVIALALSYVSQLLVLVPDLNFLEACGVYCIWTPLNHMLSAIIGNEKK